jgi:hypothetical protein
MGPWSCSTEVSSTPIRPASSASHMPTTPAAWRGVSGTTRRPSRSESSSVARVCVGGGHMEGILVETREQVRAPGACRLGCVEQLDFHRRGAGASAGHEPPSRRTCRSARHDRCGGPRPATRSANAPPPAPGAAAPARPEDLGLLGVRRGGETRRADGNAGVPLAGRAQEHGEPRDSIPKPPAARGRIALVLETERAHGGPGAWLADERGCSVVHRRPALRHGCGQSQTKRASLPHL